MPITPLDLMIASAALGALWLLMLALWWSEQHRQRANRRQREDEQALATHVAQQCREQKANAR